MARTVISGMWISMGWGPRTFKGVKETHTWRKLWFKYDETLSGAWCSACSQSSGELGSGAQIFMEDAFHLGREERVGPAALTHSREMKLYPVCERSPGPALSLQPNNPAGRFPLAPL